MIGSHSEEIPPRQTATEMLRSGCGPGASVPADTVQEGVRGPVPTKAELQRRLARLHLQTADTLMQLADLEERDTK